MPTVLLCPSCLDKVPLPEEPTAKFFSCPKCSQRFLPPCPIKSQFSDPVTDGLRVAQVYCAMCPYCAKEVVFKSKTDRRCAMCNNRIYFRHGVPLTSQVSDRLKAIDAEDMKNKRLDFMREQNAKMAALLSQIPDAFPVTWIVSIHDDRCCEFCRSQDNQLVPTLTGQLPPFHQCANKEDGCRCGSIPLSHRQVKAMFPDK